MRYVIIRDDDTNALTPVECLERLYRPLLERGHITSYGGDTRIGWERRKSQNFIGANGPLGGLPARRNRRLRTRAPIPLSDLRPYAVHAPLRG